MVFAYAEGGVNEALVGRAINNAAVAVDTEVETVNNSVPLLRRRILEHIVDREVGRIRIVPRRLSSIFVDAPMYTSDDIFCLFNKVVQTMSS